MPSGTDVRLIKRMRSERTNGSSENQDVNCKDLWFDDGNVIIASVDATRTERHLFKVHKSVLSTHSLVLRDVFALPQPNASVALTMDTYNGLPLVDFPDAPKDVEDLLTVLYYPTKLSWCQNKRITFKKIEGVLRLSTKYECRKLRKRIEQVLALDWPSSFDAWEANEIFVNELLKRSDDPYDFAETLPDSAEIIHLANECGITSVLPAAFYNIARTPELMCQPDSHRAHGYLYSSYCRESGTQGCTSEELRRVMVGRQWLRQRAWEFFAKIQRTSDERRKFCTHANVEQRHKCHSVLTEWWGSEACKFLFGMDDLLGTLRMLIDRVGGLAMVCDECREWLVGRMKGEQIDIWSHLPGFFGLEGHTNDVVDTVDSDEE
ncbi:hypothetical protein BD410DRAFT_744091 [Rickenella mellea]|uniref:BTB domain-containing protein n=1 Tax=Rickenella mellea TaxID=50990 RepID=A0A4Y7QDK3_9AGAM|nr:hypothetical protein BD410DRAFT_744091 [Rickenella mellea]